MCLALLCCAPQIGRLNAPQYILRLYLNCMPSIAVHAATTVKSTATAISTPAGEGTYHLRQGLLSIAAPCSAAEQISGVFPPASLEAGSTQPSHALRFSQIACILGTHTHASGMTSMLYSVMKVQPQYS